MTRTLTRIKDGCADRLLRAVLAIRRRPVSRTSRQVRLGVWTAFVALGGLSIIATEPALATDLQIGDIQDLLANWQSAIILLGQAILAIVVAYYVIVIGISNLSSRAIKGLGLAMAAIIGLELFDSLFLEELSGLEATDADDDWT